MRRATVRLVVGLVVGLTLLAGACGDDDDTLSEDEVEQELINAGMPADFADCVAREIGSVSAGDEEEIFDRASEAGRACASEALDESDISVPDVSVPDVSIPDISIE